MLRRNPGSEDMRVVTRASPLTALEERVLAEPAVGGGRLEVARPTGAHLLLPLHHLLHRVARPVAPLPRRGQLHLGPVEVLDEDQRVLELRLALGDLQRPPQQLQGGLSLEVPLGGAQGLVRVQQRGGLGGGDRERQDGALPRGRGWIGGSSHERAHGGGADSDPGSIPDLLSPVYTPP